jgi:hypothetical protein
MNTKSASHFRRRQQSKLSVPKRSFATVPKGSQALFRTEEGQIDTYRDDTRCRDRQRYPIGGSHGSRRSGLSASSALEPGALFPGRLARSYLLVRSLLAGIDGFIGNACLLSAWRNHFCMPRPGGVARSCSSADTS